LRGHTTGRMVLIGLDMQKVAIDFSHPGALSPNPPLDSFPSIRFLHPLPLDSLSSGRINT